MPKTYETLFPQVISEIEKRTGREIITSGTRYSVQPAGEGGSIDARSLSEIISTIVQDLGELIEARIISGLDVTATNPPSQIINITAGSATSHGKKWILENDTSLNIPLDSTTEVFFVSIYDNALEVTRTHDETKCEICKIVVPNPGVTSRIVDDKPKDGYDAWIISAKDIVFDEDDEFDDASIEKLRDVIGEILADNLIGNIRLNENLKILNTSGTLEMNSQKIKFFDFDENLLAEFNPNGIYFYDIRKREVAKFTREAAKIGNILILPNSLQSTNFASGALGSGFQIKSNGDAEFNNILARGKLTSSVFEKDTISVIGGNLLVMDGDTLNADMTILDNSMLVIKGDTSFSVGNVLRIKDGVDDEWLEVTNSSNAPIYEVARDKASQYAINNKPAWKKGTSVVNFGSSGKGGLYLTSSEINSPYISVVTHEGSPWSSLSTHLRLGNLNGFLGYVEDKYGIGIGTSNSFLKYDSTDGLQIKGSITVTGGNASIVFYQATEPVAGMKIGDYWIDTDDNNRLYIYQDSAWVEVSAGGIGITTFRQATVPIALNAGDLWIDTDDNKLYRATNAGDDEITPGEWELQNAAIATGWSYDGDTTKIDGGNLWVGSSIILGSSGYIRSGQTAYNTGTGWWIGDVSGTPKFSIGDATTKYITWDGSALSIRGSLNADDIVAGTLNVDRIAASSITAAKLDVSQLSAIAADLGTITAGTVTGATLQTASSGARVLMNTTNLIAYDDATNEIFKILISGADVGDVIIGNYAGGKGILWDKSAAVFYIKGDITASSGVFTGTINIGTAGKVYIDGANEIIKVYDASNNLRVELGLLT